MFHTDIARDFLLIEDVVVNRHITLIGPRSGIGGIFHGPLWLYMNAPAFILGNGNPLVVGMFWTLLMIIAIYSLYFVGTKLFNKTTGILSAVLFSVFTIPISGRLYNPYAAVMSAPIFFFFFVCYLRKNNVKYLIAAFFVLGIIIQFQSAFGGPILLLSVLYLIPYFVKRKKILHLSSLMILLIPLSTYILFDLKHQFLQLNSLLGYLLSGKESYGSPFLLILAKRSLEMTTKGFQLLPNSFSWFTPVCVAYIAYWFISKKYSKKIIIPYLFFLYLYAGYWIITLGYKGVLWNYYYLPFLSIIIIVFSSLHTILPKRLFYGLFICVVGLNLFFEVKGVLSSDGFIGKNVASWKFNKQVAEEIFRSSPPEFGYFIFTPDQFGYSPRYAMNYVQRMQKSRQAYPFEKKTRTYLIIAPPPDDRPFLNGAWWKTNQVNIQKKPDRVISFPNKFRIEQYTLTPEEITVSADPNLINSLIFR